MTDATRPAAVPSAAPEPPSPELVELAAAHGVATDFWDWQGRHTVVTRESVEAVLTALGVPSHTTESVRASLADARLAPWRRTLPATVVVRSGRPTEVPVHLPHGSSVRVRAELEHGGSVDLTQVDRWVEPQWIDGAEVGEATFAIPVDLPLGWHRLVAEVEAAGDGGGTATGTLVVTPDRLDLPPAVAEGPAAWGLMGQLYSVRS